MDATLDKKKYGKSEKSFSKTRNKSRKIIAIILIVALIIISIMNIFKKQKLAMAAITYYLDKVEVRSLVTDDEKDIYNKKINCAINTFIINNSTNIEEKDVMESYNKIFGKDDKVTKESIRYMLSYRKLLKLDNGESQSTNLSNIGKSFILIKSINEKFENKYDVCMDIVSDADMDTIRNYYSNNEKNSTIDFANLYANNYGTNVDLSKRLTKDNYKQLAKGNIKQLTLTLKMEKNDFKIVDFKSK